MNNVLALQKLSYDVGEQGGEGQADTGQEAGVSHASALACGGDFSHLSLTVCG